MILFNLFFISSSSVLEAAEYTELGFNHKGAFILSEDTPIKKGNKYFHARIGYLPVGTLMMYDPDPKTEENIFNYDPKIYKEEPYKKVITELGQKGFVKFEQIQTVGDNSFLVAVGNEDNIYLESPQSTKE